MSSSEDPRIPLCRRLQWMGVDARPVGSRKELYRDISVSKSSWPVDVTEGLIRQITIRESFVADFYESGTWADRQIEYLVPDPRIASDIPERRARSSRRRRWLELFGPVVGVRWVRDSWSQLGLWDDIINRLNQDESLNREVAGTGRDFAVRADPSQGCWVFLEALTDRNPKDLYPRGGDMTSLVDSVARRTPSPLQWDCYQAIAKCLLAMPIPKDE